MTHNDTAYAVRSLNTLADDCLEHLQREAHCMEQINESLLRIRAALVAVDPVGLSAALDLQHAAAMAMAHVQASRHQLRQQIAQQLGVSVDEATVRQLAEQTLPPRSHALLSLREQLRQLVHQSRRLAEGNSLLTHNWSRMIDRVLECITGQAAPAERYDATGAKDGPPPTSLFQARC